AAGLRVPGVTVAEPDTNIVIATLAAPPEVPRVLAALEAKGVRMVGFGTGRIRAICHLDVDDAGVERAVAAWRGALGVHAQV
ncbi:MAG TPA: low specificity L-threonine aldolase, partial [Dongiaceae bacterium]|nr:low specificity L-threonine aldolase [Dongiaceae bacterium]